MIDKNTIMWNWIKQFTGYDKLYFNFGEATDNNCIFIPMPSDYFIVKYIDGSILRHYEFAFTYFKDIDTIPFGTSNITSYSLVQSFMNWIDTQDKQRNFPIFDNTIIVQKISNLQNMPNLAGQSNELAKYMCQVRLEYVEKES